MRNLGLPLFSCLLVLAFAMTLACGSSSTAPRSIQSITLSPASADAQNYPDGQVPFTAIGVYSAPPSPVQPITATWGACTLDGNVTNAVTVTNSGTAQCVAGSSGKYQVWAFDLNATGPVCNVMNACGGGCGRVTGTAQLTCP